MLLELFRRGPSTDGIFRKSALMKTVKQLKQELEEGKNEVKIIIVIVIHNIIFIIMAIQESYKLEGIMG